MIPKIIHYCWFGNSQKPDRVRKYIDNWKKMLPDYQIMEWNEKNFDVNYNIYTKEAYERRKYAFVSDVARLYALHEFGGVYLDTDIEIKRDLTPILEKYHCILGYEAAGDHLMTAFLAAEKNSKIIKDLLKTYKEEVFVKKSGELNVYPNTYRITELLRSKGAKLNGKFEKFQEIAIFPEEYFSAMEFSTMMEISNSDTYTVHHFSSSWKPWYVRIRRYIKVKIIAIINKCKGRR